MYYNKVQNVFDEIYYTWDRNLFVQTDFTNLPALKENRIQGYIYPGDNKMTDELQLIFNDFYIKKNVSVHLNIYPSDREIGALCIVYYDGTKSLPVTEGGGEGFVISAVYEEKTKKLMVKPVRAFSDSMAKKYPAKYETFEDYSDSEFVEMFMEEHSITKKDIEEYKEYFVNEVLIGMWLDGNAKESRFTRDHVGDFTIQDNLFENLSE